MYKKITDENSKNSEKSIIKKGHCTKTVGDGKNFDCIFGFSVKSYVRNTINLSCAKILLTSVMEAGKSLITGFLNHSCAMDPLEIPVNPAELFFRKMY